MKRNIFVFLGLLILTAKSEAITLAEWKKLSKNEQIEYLSSEIEDIQVSLDDKRILSNFLSRERKEIISPTIRKITEKISKVKTTLNTYVEDDFYALVGSIKRSAQVYFSEDNYFLGASVMYLQQGCSHEDEYGDFVEGNGHYSTIQDAERNNCYDNDVSWAGHSVINHEFKEIANTDYMEWTGH